MADHKDKTFHNSAHNSAHGTTSESKGLTSVLDNEALKNMVDEQKRMEILLKLTQRISATMVMFRDAFRVRREQLLELNAIYRNRSYLDKNRAEWQTKSFYPLSYDAVERKTSMLHQALYGDTVSSPYTVLGRTSEDHEYAFSAETLLNNTMDRIGFFSTSEECLRSTAKFGLGVYFYGWEKRSEVFLWREPIRDDKGKVMRDAQKKATLRFVQKTRTTSQPFVRAIDIVDRLGFDPRAKKFSKWDADFVYIVEDLSPEKIKEREKQGEYDVGTFDRLMSVDPHGLTSYMGDQTDDKETQIRNDEGVQDTPLTSELVPSYKVVNWWGWFDINGDGMREFVRVVSIPDRKLIMKAEKNLMNEYPLVDVPYSRSLHSMTAWGVIDPVVQIQYDINERRNQRGDAVKLKLNPQFMINVDRIMEDHAYVSIPGAMHPFTVGDGDVRSQMRVLEFQNTEFLSWEDEDRDMNMFARSTGVADFNQVLSSTNKDTPASTIISIFNQQQEGNSLIINGILNQHGTLGSRVLQMIQLFGDEEFVLRSAGKRGLEFRRESMENVLGEYDVKVTTGTFLGNKAAAMQHLLQLKPLLAQSPHIDQVELDRAIFENVLPKRMDRIINVPEEPMSPADEQFLILAGQGESLSINLQESLIDLRSKIRVHTTFINSEDFGALAPETQGEFREYITKLQERAQQLEIEQQLQAQQAQRGQGSQPGPDGNLTNTGLPEVREQGNQIRPLTNNF